MDDPKYFAAPEGLLLAAIQACDAITEELQVLKRQLRQLEQVQIEDDPEE